MIENMNFWLRIWIYNLVSNYSACKNMYVCVCIVTHMYIHISI